MYKDQKDELIVMLKRQNTDLEEKLRLLKKSCEDLQKGDSAAEAKIRALSEMHAQKIKTLLKSIQNLKKEEQKEKFEKKDNVRAMRIEALKKEHEDFEVAINALRKLVNNEDKCDQAIKNELQKGPKRIRIASREELKMEIKKYKNMALRLLELLKQHDPKLAVGFKIDSEAGTGIKVDTAAAANVFDINDMSQRDGASQMEGEAGKEEGILDADWQEQKDRLEEQIVKLNQEGREKNERLLELLEEMEDLKIQVYARDKSIALQQKQIEDLLEELRDVKSYENDIKLLVGKKIALEEENTRLRKEMDSRFVYQSEKQFESSSLMIENRTLQEDLAKLQKQIQESKKQVERDFKQLRDDKTALEQKLLAAEQERDKAKKDLLSAEKAATDAALKLNNVDGQSKGAIQAREQDLEAFRKRVVELEKEGKLKDDRLIQLEAKVVEISTELADKDYEIQFYATSIEELQNEILQLQQSGPGKSAKAGSATAVDQAALQTELDQWKQKCKILKLNEVKYLEEIEQLKAQKAAEDKERTVNNLINRDKQRSQSRGRQNNAADDADGIE